MKYGQTIGFARQDIAAGEHVHSHHCAFGEHGRDFRLGAALDSAWAALERALSDKFG